MAAARSDLITRSTLLDEGVTAKAIAHRLRTGRLIRVHPGVYTTSHAPLTFERRSLAAVMACGDGSRLRARPAPRPRLAAAGYRTVRVTWRQLTNEPEAVVAIVAAALAR